ncbi:MAG: ankyrin repeat domain-containing protein [Magnetococcales bacterium]|nr:ankyrin repeat domain-containing protein [Magnetococcales bacterium]
MDPVPLPDHSPETTGATVRGPLLDDPLPLFGEEINTPDLQGQTALMRAARNGETGKVEELLKAGAKVNHKDWWGQTALTLAIQSGNRETIDLLLSHDAKLTA